MPTSLLPTSPASGGRADAEELRRQSALFAEGSLTPELLDAVPSLLVILNRHRQIVYANKTLLDTLGPEVAPIGLRPGEALDCHHALKEPEGCGSAEPCGACGMLSAILASMAGRRVVRECTFTRHRGEGSSEAMDLQVWATPLEHGGEPFTVFAISDISSEKRRRALERIFFHDLLNVVGSIRGFSQLLREFDPEEKEEIFALIHSAAEQAVDEIEAQRTLLAAETRELKVDREPLRAGALARQLVEIFRRQEIARDREILFEESPEETIMETDRALLGRVLGNMIKNALEATGRGGTVRVGVRRLEDMVEFRVNNPAVIRRQEQLQIFQRSFSTKGLDRGLGTYSMKLLSDYLQGEVTFDSAEGEGTTFRARYPIRPSAAAD